MLQLAVHVISWIDSHPVGLLFPTYLHTSIQLGKKLLMTIQLRDIKGGFIVVAAGATLVAMLVFLFRHFFRSFTFRKDSSVALYGRYGTLSGMTVPSEPTPAPGAAHASAVAPTLDLGNVDDETSPIDPSEATPFVTMLASEEVLRRDWDSPEEDEAWAHL